MLLALRSKVWSGLRRLLLDAALAALALGAFAPTAASAADAPPMPSLRHLVFSFDVSEKDETEKHTEATISGANADQSQGVASSGAMGHIVKSGATTQRKGQIVIDVLEATQDGGLIVDVKQTSAERAAPVARVGIDWTGGLLVPPTAVVTEEEAALMRLLSRGLMGGATRAKGESWDIVEDSATGTSGLGRKTTLRVTDVTPPNLQTIDLLSTFTQSGIHGVDGTAHGKVDYDSKVLVPRQATLTYHERSQTPEGLITTDLSLQLALVQDSFAKP